MQSRHVVEARLFAQIATHVRHRIAAGQLIPGDRLPSLRDAAREWGVNLHTVRRAYAQLESEGLVETSNRRRAVVTEYAAETPAAHPEGLDVFLSRVAETAHARFGLSPAEVAARLVAVVSPAPQIWVLECGAALAEGLAKQVAAWSGLPVKPWLVSRAAELPEGYYLGTYYHYAELRSALAGRRHAPAFFAVRFEGGFLERLRARALAASRVIVLAVDARSGKALVADLQNALGPGTELVLRTTRRPLAALAQCPAGVPVVLSPENWDRLPESERTLPDRFPLIFEPLESHLTRIGAAFGWLPQEYP